MTRKRVILGAGLVLLVAAAAILPDAFDRQLKSIFVGEERVYQLDESPTFLSEELALMTAWEALRSDGYDTNTWRPVPDDRSVALDGRRDDYLVRNTIHPNHGRLTFEDQAGMSRFVHVELDSNRITACVVIPK